MIAGPPREARWVRAEPLRSLPAADLARIVQSGLGPCRILEVHPLTEGLRNANFKVRIDKQPDWIVLRVYQHDASLCQKEIDLLKLVAHAVPVPRVIHAEPGGLDGLPPFLLMEYVEGITFHRLKRSGDRDAVQQAAFSLGHTLAAIDRIKFSKSGWLGPGPNVTAPLLEGDHPTPRFVDLCLASPNLQAGVPTELRALISGLVWAKAPQLAESDAQTSLVHGDFGKRNVMLRSEPGRWAVAAVLDWEFAVSGSPLIDIGHFLRYEPDSAPILEPFFSRGYQDAGGNLPTDWRQLARVLDLVALCESLTHDDLPSDVALELVELVRATAENRDPKLV
jgi:aminoglycoside phosphotransferase (APT) family kinase protein